MSPIQITGGILWRRYIKKVRIHSSRLDRWLQPVLQLSNEISQHATRSPLTVVASDKNIVTKAKEKPKKKKKKGGETSNAMENIIKEYRAYHTTRWSPISKSNNTIMTRTDNIRVIKIPRPPSPPPVLLRYYNAPWLLRANDSCLFCKQRVSRKGWRDFEQRERRRGWKEGESEARGKRGAKKEGGVESEKGVLENRGRIITSFVRRLEPPHLRNCGSRSSRDCDRWIPQGRRGFC